MVSTSNKGKCEMVSTSNCDRPHCDGSCRVVRNTDPTKFKIASVEFYYKFTIVEVTYEGCEGSFEGKKILVLKGDQRNALYSVKSLDPHFTKDGLLVARFVATPEGYGYAKSFCIAAGSSNLR